MALGEPPHTVSESQVDGFKPVNHYRVAGRKETESEWYEVVVNVPIPEAAERKHVNVVLDGDSQETLHLIASSMPRSLAY